MKPLRYYVAKGYLALAYMVCIIGVLMCSIAVCYAIYYGLFVIHDGLAWGVAKLAIAVGVVWFIFWSMSTAVKIVDRYDEAPK